MSRQKRCLFTQAIVALWSAKLICPIANSKAAFCRANEICAHLGLGIKHSDPS